MPRSKFEREIVGSMDAVESIAAEESRQPKATWTKIVHSLGRRIRPWEEK